MDEHERLGRLMEAVAEFQSEARRTFQRDKKKARFAVLGGASATAGVTAVLAIGATGGEARWPVTVAALLAFFATVILAWDGHFNHRGLWLHRGWILAHINDLSTRMKLEVGTDDEPTKAQVDAWMPSSPKCAGKTVRGGEPLIDRALPEDGI